MSAIQASLFFYEMLFLKFVSGAVPPPPFFQPIISMIKISKILALCVLTFQIACSNDDEDSKDISEALTDVTDIE